MLRAAAVVIVMSATCAYASDDWRLVERETDYVLYKRQAAGSAVAAYRLEADFSAPVERVAQAHLREAPQRGGKEDGDRPRMRMLRDEGDVKIIYNYVSVPLVADRDLVLRSRQQLDPKAGVYRFLWHTVTDEGPPVPEGVVRIQRSEGMWEFTRVEPERTHVVFESLTDIGGSIPAWLVNRLYRGQVLGQFEDLRRKLGALQALQESTP
jgi:hypothetical protein